MTNWAITIGRGLQIPADQRALGSIGGRSEEHRGDQRPRGGGEVGNRGEPRRGPGDVWQAGVARLG